MFIGDFYIKNREDFEDFLKTLGLDKYDLQEIDEWYCADLRTEEKWAREERDAEQLYSEGLLSNIQNAAEEVQSYTRTMRGWLKGEKSLRYLGFIDTIMNNLINNS